MSTLSTSTSRPGTAAPARGTPTVVVLHRGGPFIRGTEAVCLRAAKAFADAGYHLVVCRNNACLDNEILALAPSAEIRNFHFPELYLEGLKGTSLPIPAYLRALFQLMRIARRHNTVLLYCSGGLPCQLAVPVGRFFRIPVLCHFHHPAARRLQYLWLLRLADKLVFPSVFVQQQSLPYHRKTGSVVYNGIDLTRFKPAPSHTDAWRAKLGIPSDATVIGQVGALVPNKRPDFLVSAFSSLRKMTTRPLHLCIVGTGPMEGLLRQMVKDPDIARDVTLTGYVDDVLPYYQHVFDINVLVSREEGLGISVIEGSACGLPAVVTNCTGLPEAVRANASGFLFDVADIAGLQNHLLRLTEDPSLRATMGRAGIEYARERFSADSFETAFMSAVRDLLH
ncbi:MAG: glycosyltransferase family 4 protein [Steroidobacteraceae bacterium]